jgi:PAS domain-containing protein
MSRGTVAERDAQGRPARLAGMDVDITAHHEVEDALRASEAKSSTIYLTLPDPAGIARMSDGRMLEANPAFCELLGLPRDQILGRTAQELNLWARPDEHTRLLNAVLRDGQAHQLPMLAGATTVPRYRGACPRGQCRWTGRTALYSCSTT